MAKIVNVYCDESCHLAHDQQQVMTLGAVWCPRESVRGVTDELRDIKRRHGLTRDFEAKWVKVSPSKVSYYLDVVRYFLAHDELHFRGLVVPDKAKLRHDLFGQTHDERYYKMYYVMLEIIFTLGNCYHVYLDIKDTRGAAKMRKLHEVVCNSLHDLDRECVTRVQLVRSHEVELLQLADLLTGAVTYANRGEFASSAKLALVRLLEERVGHALTYSTVQGEQKLNILRWVGREDRS